MGGAVPGHTGPVAPDEVIVCVECGGRAHLLSWPPEDGRWLAGDVVAYRCADCLDRFDIVLDDTDE
jgi:DNA-directed RNA polymerase subunit RPC12/RpoP